MHDPFTIEQLNSMGRLRGDAAASLALVHEVEPFREILTEFALLLYDTSPRALVDRMGFCPPPSANINLVAGYSLITVLSILWCRPPTDRANLAREYQSLGLVMEEPHTMQALGRMHDVNWISQVRVGAEAFCARHLIRVRLLLSVSDRPGEFWNAVDHEKFESSVRRQLANMAALWMVEPQPAATVRTVAYLVNRLILHFSTLVHGTLENSDGAAIQELLTGEDHHLPPEVLGRWRRQISAVAEFLYAGYDLARAEGLAMNEATEIACVRFLVHALRNRELLTYTLSESEPELGDAEVIPILS